MTTTKPKRASRQPQKPYAARAMILALTLTGTLSGWAALAHTAPVETQPAATVAASSAARPDSILILAPIPTVIPPPSGQTMISSAQISPALLAPIPAISQPAQAPLVRTRSSR